jgi:hypothetical protein
MIEKCTDPECERRKDCKASPRWRNECDFYISNGTNLQEQRDEIAEERQSFIQDVMN